MNKQQQISSFCVKSIEEDRIFTGYASVFDCVDFQNDQVLPGAFSKSLSAWQEKGMWPKMLWQHNHHHPIGEWLDMREDAKGLWVKGHLLLDVRKGREAYALLKRNVVNGLSIGFSLEKAAFSPKGHQLLQEVHLHEISLVTFAANPKAQVEWVKSIDMTTEYRLAHVAGMLVRKITKDQNFEMRIQEGKLRHETAVSSCGFFIPIIWRTL